MAKTTKNSIKKEVRVYDPEKGYKWEPDDVFILTGNEFGLLYQTLKNEITLPSGLSAKQKVDAFHSLDAILKKHYEQGLGVEVPTQQN